MKITVKQLKQLIKEQVESMAGSKCSSMSNEELVEELRDLAGELANKEERERDWNVIDDELLACEKEILSRMR